MARKHHKPEEIVTKLRQVEVLAGQGLARVDAIHEYVKTVVILVVRHAAKNERNYLFFCDGLHNYVGVKFQPNTIIGVVTHCVRVARVKRVQQIKCVGFLLGGFEALNFSVFCVIVLINLE